jgi:hypothetical protein
MNKKTNENYLLLAVGWNDEGVLIPMSAAGMLKDALWFQRASVSDSDGNHTYVNKVSGLDTENGPRIKILSQEVVDAAIVAGKLTDEKA